MIWLKWKDLPEFMQNPEVRPYYEHLSKIRWQIYIKRCFDIIVALLLIILLALPMIIIAVCIKTDSKGKVLFRQERITSFGKVFRIHKFRSMVANAEKIGTSVTVTGDSRVTRVGRVLRKYRLDELPQLIDVIKGDMSFVGTRPEDKKYVSRYKPEYYATLLLPAGITSEASIQYKDEYLLLDASTNVDKTYVEQVLPEKMKYNLASIRNFSLPKEVLTMLKTVKAVLS